MGGSSSKSQGSSNNSFQNNIWGPQGNALQQLYQMALGSNPNAGNSQVQGSADNINNAMNNIIGNNQNINNQGSAFGDSNELRDKLLGMMGGPSQTGQMYESIVGGQGNTYIDPVVSQMRDSMKQNVDTLQNNNALDAAMMGQSGGSRQAMENAMIGSQANKDMMAQEAQLRAGAYDKDLAMKMGIANLADSNKQAEQDRLFNMLSGNNQQNNTLAVNNNNLLQTILSGGMNPYLQAQQANWTGLQNIASILGGPIMESSGSGGSKHKGSGASGGLFGG